MRRALLPLPLLLLCAWAQGLAAADLTPYRLDEAAIARDAAALLAIPDRSPGSPGAAQAVDYLEAELAKLGPSVHIWRVTTSPLLATDKGSSLTLADGTSLPGSRRYRAGLASRQ